MLLTHHSLALLLFFVSSSLASPLDRRHSNVTSLASCAPTALLVDQFTTFTGNAGQKPHITFYIMNPNPGASNRLLCTATLGSNEGSFNGSSFYSCEQPGTGFNWQSGQLKIFQYQVCTNGLVKYIDHSGCCLSTPLTSVPSTVSHQIVIAAQGEIATTSYPGENGGEYSESVTGSNSIPVVEVQDVRSMNGGPGRTTDERNVTCGFVGPFNIVYTLGSCNLSAVGPALK